MGQYCYCKQNYSQNQFTAFKIAYSCMFSLGGNLDFLDFLQKMFYHINYWWRNYFSDIWPQIISNVGSKFGQILNKLSENHQRLKKFGQSGAIWPRLVTPPKRQIFLTSWVALSVESYVEKIWERRAVFNF